MAGSEKDRTAFVQKMARQAILKQAAIQEVDDG
jgi:hypothetical protein